MNSNTENFTEMDWAPLPSLCHPSPHAEDNMKTHTGYNPGKTYCRVAQAKSGACVCVTAEQEAADSQTGVGHSGTRTGLVLACRPRLGLLLLRTVSRVYRAQIPFPGESRLSEEKHAGVAAGEAFPVPTSRLHSALFRTAVTMCIAHMNENTQTHGHGRARKRDTWIKHR